MALRWTEQAGGHEKESRKEALCVPSICDAGGFRLPPHLPRIKDKHFAVAVCSKTKRPSVTVWTVDTAGWVGGGKIIH